MPREQGQERPTSLQAFESAVLGRLAGWPRATPPLPDAWLARTDARASAEERLAVYAHMYRARLAETLAATFPRLARLMSEDELLALAAAYAADVPSRHPSLRFFGRALPDWLATHRSDVPGWSSLAALEWSRSDVFDEVDEPVLTAEELQARAAAQGAGLPLRLVRAHRLLRTPMAASVLWDEAGEGPESGRDADSSPSRERPEHLLVFRQGVVVYHRVIDRAERAALEAVGQGTTLGALCELAARNEPSAEVAAARVRGWVSLWLGDELLTAHV